jgi:Family of unknown function (DUF6152)
MMQRRTLLAAVPTLVSLQALAHHGWSSFDQERPIYLGGRAAKVSWRNPHAELQLEVPENLALPADLARRSLPRQTAAVDGAALLAKARVPTRPDRRWQVELAPLTRMQAWGIEEIKAGAEIAVLGFTFTGEQGEPVLRVEYLFIGDKTYGLRSSPA